MMIWKTSAVAAAIVISGATAFAQAVPERVVYDNSTTYLDAYFPVENDLIEYGDEVVMTEGLGEITQFRFEYYLSGGTGNETAQLSFRQVVNGEVGQLLAAPITIGLTTIGKGMVQLTGLAIPFEGHNVLWSVRFGGLDEGQDAGLLFYDPPTVGSSFDDFWAATGAGWALVTPAATEPPGNFGAQIIAVPEPGTWALMLSGLGFLGYLRLRRTA